MVEQRRLRASCSSRVRLDVTTTAGGSAPRPGSGIVTLKSEDLEQERLELVVRAIELVDEQHGAGARPDRPQRRLDQELGAVQVDRPAALRARREQLPR